ncbi:MULTISPECIES: hypothetical protein [Rhizobium]|uniref:Uncharacterized protein n=1 Tax=Rhizobium esperanzae TaxID=1967781 RepID=A0A7W6XYA7_9HYPH|nr:MULTISPECIES: hypothetical protein [Rhizobium]MBB4440780.1 hypothetical protein [Rhizobium esperanzae]MDH6203421.1 hypothetical protein [Rhizobium leguminosarum]
MNVKTDGLDALRAEIGIGEIASLIERTARWVAPETFRLLPVWYPEHARRRHFFKCGWSEPQTNTNRTTKVTVHKVEGNIKANQALTLALGLRKSSRPNWTCCHLWGVDDATFQKSNDVVSDHRFYSCVANMVLLPTPLKAFTDVMPEIKAMMRICARNLYGWQCDHESMLEVNESLDHWNDWSDYPKSWVRVPGEGRPLGVVDLTPKIEAQIAKRRAAIFQDLEHAGTFYPRDEVKTALAYWGIEVPQVAG